MQFLELENFIKKNKNDKKEDIYSNIDEMLNSTLDSEEKINKLVLSLSKKVL